LVEVIEHLEPYQLEATVNNLFCFARPSFVVVTTPERDFNVNFEGMKGLRHRDHRFEFSRAEFREWCAGVSAVASGAGVTYCPVYFGIGPEVDGSRPTQGCLFLKGMWRSDARLGREYLSSAINQLGEEVDCCVW